MKKWFLITVVGILFCSLVNSENNFGNSKLTGQLLEKMESVPGNEFIRINIMMNEQYDSQELLRNTNELTKPEKREYVVNELKSFRSRSQREILVQMETLENKSLIQNIKPLWITNVINCFALKEAIYEISQKKDIKSIDWDEERNMLLDYNVREQKYLTNNSTDRDITWNVTLVDADDVWALDYTGEGVVVAVVDTGVRYTHQDLQDHIWENEDYPYHGYDFANNDNDPMDGHGHGTHCAGTVAGDGTAGSQTGIAPDATIMCLKVLGDDGNGNESNVWSAMEFAVEQGADIVSMSLGWQHSWGTNRQAWRNCMDNSLAAGLISSVAAGNEGDWQWTYPIPDNVRSPGDCPPPWLHPDQTLIGGTSGVVCIGATNSNDVLGGFSSRGPVTWQDVTDYNDYEYNPGMGLIRPDICAPGVNVTSLGHYSDTAYEHGWDGTSMATPCVAGVMALMLSKNYTLTPAQIDQIIEENAAIPQSPKNNDYGSGRVNALASVNATTPPNSPPDPAVNPDPADEQVNVAPFTDLDWQDGGGGIATSFQVFFGTDDPPTNILNGVEVFESFYDLDSNLENETQYFWRIDSFNEFGSATGDVWTFTTSPIADEDFETGDFSLFDWTFEGHAEWTIDDSQAINGFYSAKSGEIGNVQFTTLKIELDIIAEGEISFWKKISTEENFDELKFFINGSVLDEWSGEIDWSESSFPVSVGNHVFKWTYVKYNGGESGEDCVWIDYIFFPQIGELNPPVLEIDPTEFYQEMMIGESTSEYMFLSNVGGGEINYSISLDFQSPETGWMYVNSSSGNLLEGETDQIRVSFYTSTLDAGTYYCDIVITDDIRNETIVPVTLVVSETGLEEELNLSKTQLLGNYPNPFNPRTTISFFLKEKSTTQIDIYDIKGQKVRSLVSDELPAGEHLIDWNGEDDQMGDVGSGTYLIKMKVDPFSYVKKMILMK